MFKVTVSAAEQVRKAAKQSGTEEMSLRLAANRRPDGSFDYIMGFDHASDDDIRFKSEGVDIVIAPEYVPMLDKTVMDFVVIEDSSEAQFIFLNPEDANYSAPSES
jgi:iron-sulfur cluster assembly protein